MLIQMLRLSIGAQFSGWSSLTGGFGGPATVGLSDTVPDYQFASFHSWLEHLPRERREKVRDEQNHVEPCSSSER